jgi:agmatine/peptidylarginine deiminase
MGLYIPSWQVQNMNPMDMNILVKEPIKSNDKSASISNFTLARNNNTVIVPVFGLKGDEKVAGTVEEVLRGNRILTINANEIAKDGGVLNCISWNILA